MTDQLRSREMEAAKIAALKTIRPVSFLEDRPLLRDAIQNNNGVVFKTIGDAYMVASGVPTPRADHLDATAEMALDMQAAMETLGHQDSFDLRLRIGINF